MEKKKVITYMDQEFELAKKSTLANIRDSHCLLAIAAGIRYLVEKSE